MVPCVKYKSLGIQPEYLAARVKERRGTEEKRRGKKRNENQVSEVNEIQKRSWRRKKDGKVRKNRRGILHARIAFFEARISACAAVEEKNRC